MDAIPEAVTAAIELLVTLPVWGHEVAERTKVPYTTIRSRATKFFPPQFPDTALLKLGDEKLAVLLKTDGRIYLDLILQHRFDYTQYLSFSKQPNLHAAVKQIQTYLEQFYTIRQLHEEFTQAHLQIPFRTLWYRCTKIKNPLKRIPSTRFRFGEHFIRLIVKEDAQQAIEQYREELATRLGVPASEVAEVADRLAEVGQNAGKAGAEFRQRMVHIRRKYGLTEITLEHGPDRSSLE